MLNCGQHTCFLSYYDYAVLVSINSGYISISFRIKLCLLGPVGLGSTKFRTICRDAQIQFVLVIAGVKCCNFVRWVILGCITLSTFNVTISRFWYVFEMDLWTSPWELVNRPTWYRSHHVMEYTRPCSAVNITVTVTAAVTVTKPIPKTIMYDHYVKSDTTNAQILFIIFILMSFCWLAYATIIEFVRVVVDNANKRGGQGRMIFVVPGNSQWNNQNWKKKSGIQRGLCERNWGPFSYRGLISIPSWISNYIQYRVWDELTYPSPTFNGCTFEVWEWISNFIWYFGGMRLLIHAGIWH